MDIFTILLWIITLTWFVISIKKDKSKTLNSVEMSVGMMKSIGTDIIGILFLIGLLLTFIPPETIKQYMGESSSFLSTITFSYSRKYNSYTSICSFSVSRSTKHWNRKRIRRRRYIICK